MNEFFLAYALGVLTGAWFVVLQLSGDSPMPPKAAGTGQTLAAMLLLIAATFVP